MISFIPRLVPAYAQAWEQGYHMIHKTVSLIARDCSAFHLFQYILEETKCSVRAGLLIQILHKIQYQQNYSGDLVISHTNEEF